MSTSPTTPVLAQLLAHGGTLLFQGDSITDAFRKPEELNDAYRLGAGFTLLIGSLLRATSGRTNLAVVNRGIAGHNASNLLGRWQRDTLEVGPDVLSLLVGINDANQAAHDGRDPLPAFRAACDRMLKELRNALPRCRLVLCEPFSLAVPGCHADLHRHCATLRTHVRQLAATCGATLVPLQAAFDAVAGDHPEFWIYDGIHPTAAGHWLIAQTWLQTVAGISLVPAVATVADASSAAP